MSELLHSIRAYAIEHDVPVISFDGIRFLSQIVRLSKAKTVLELGTAIGFTSIYLVKEHNVTITTIERDMDMVEQAKENIEKSGFEDNIKLIHDDAIYVQTDILGTFDVIFIDAAKAQTKHLFDKYKPLLNEGGCIVVDNLLFHGLHNNENLSRPLNQMMRKLDEFNHYVLEQTEFDTTIYPIGDGMSLSIKRMG
jgi:predicted O-methyltransferase YrrM